MAMPKQVEEAASLAEELHSRIFDEQEQAHPEEEPQEQEPETVPEQIEDSELEELRRYKERYLSLKGKYDNEVPRLNEELQTFKQTVFDRIGDINKPAQQQEEEDPRIAKWKEDYGDEVLDMINFFTKKNVDPILNERLAPVAKQVESVESAQLEASQNNFMAYLDSTVKGDWRRMWNGEDPKFLDFLKQPDPSGLYTYGDLVNMYNEKWDGDRLAKVMNAYVDSTPSVQPRQSTPKPDAMITPNRSTPHTAPSIDNAKIWTPSLIEEFKTADRKGKYDSETSQAMWNDLLSAMNEGRIRQ
jgi:hypothetical protein